jgi:hypothetical protein
MPGPLPKEYPAPILPETASEIPPLGPGFIAFFFTTILYIAHISNVNKKIYKILALQVWI